jgi:hypothetical protein
MISPPLMRDIRKDPGFEDSASTMLGSVQLADEALNGVEWGLIRETDFSKYPKLGPTKHGELYAFKTPPIGQGNIALVVFFTCDERQLRLHNVIRSISDGNED